MERVMLFQERKVEKPKGKHRAWIWALELPSGKDLKVPLKAGGNPPIPTPPFPLLAALPSQPRALCSLVPGVLLPAPASPRPVFLLCSITPAWLCVGVSFTIL